MKKEMLFESAQKTAVSPLAGTVASATVHQPPDTSFRYVLFSEEKSLPEIPAPFQTFGIRVISEGENGQQLLQSVSDVSVDREVVESIVALCNREKLEPIHLTDVIEDTLALPV